MSRSLLIMAAALLGAAAIATAAPLEDLSAFGYNPKANPAAVVTSGAARFTVLTPYVIRVEYSATQGGEWEDRATIAIVNRHFVEVPTFTHTITNGLLAIRTAEVSLEYAVGTAFDSQTLNITSSGGAIWKYGDTDHQNLFGAVRSLDMECTVPMNCSLNAGIQVHNESLHCAWGVISRGGWTTIDDAGNYIMSNTSGEWFSSTMRNVDQVDQYFFGHASNYRQALADFTSLAGKIPLLPRPLLGSWYTRWFDFDNSDIERLVEIYEKEHIPLTTLVFDMNWHTKNSWTGWSWDKQLFPNPADNLAWLRSKGLIIAANIHDADGVGWWETKYNEMCRAMGQDPSTLDVVPFAPLNETYMHALEDIVFKNIGINLAWIDWQQGGWAGDCTGGRLNPTIITDHVRGTDSLRQDINQRDSILARFGGLGSHRYPVGFSGDVLELTWECMAFQPFFSITGANVGYGYWSNDLVGPADDHELHVRWMQFGAFSGIMRIHDRGMSTGSCYSSGTCAIVNIWKIPYHYFDAIRVAMLQRVALLPYLYTEAYNAYVTGVTPAYPMYYDFPDHNDAYAMGPDGAHAQYMFGSQMLVAPICAAADSTTAMATKEIWLPPGVWYDDVFGTLHNSIGTYIESQYALEDTPLFVKGGAIIPRLPNPSQIGVATQKYDAMDFYIYPGASSGSYLLYEDDGMSYDYLFKRPDESMHFTNISYVSTATGITITVKGTTMTASWLPTMRKLRFFLVQTAPLTSASVSGTALPYARFGGVNAWTYDGKTVTTILDVGAHPIADSMEITATFFDVSTTELGYAKGFASRSRLAKRILDDLRITPDETSFGPGLLKQAGAHAVDLSYLASTTAAEFKTAVTAYPTLMGQALAEIGGNPSAGDHHSQLTQLYDHDRKDMLLCGSKNCLNINYQYTVMWSEGYQPSSVSGESVPLHQYYSSTAKDNYATTSATAPGGYSAATFSNGNVYNTNGTGRMCLAVYHDATTGDHLTTAAQEGKEFARGNNYVKTHDCVGYVDTIAPGVESHQFSTKYAGKTAGELAKIFDSFEKKSTAAGSSRVTSSSFKMNKKASDVNKKLTTGEVAAKSESVKKNYMVKNTLTSSNAMAMSQALLQSCLPPS